MRRSTAAALGGRFGLRASWKDPRLYCCACCGAEPTGDGTPLLYVSLSGLFAIVMAGSGPAALRPRIRKFCFNSNRKLGSEGRSRLWLEDESSEADVL